MCCPARFGSGRDLHMDGALADCKRSFLDGLRAGRVRVTGAGEIFRAAAELHEHAGFMDHLAGLAPDDVHTEHAIGLRICENFDKTVGGLVDPGPRIGGRTLIHATWAFSARFLSQIPRRRQTSPPPMPQTGGGVLRFGTPFGSDRRDPNSTRAEQERG